MKPLRICFFNRSYYPDFGATGQLLTELAEDLRRDYGCEVSVVTGTPLLEKKADRSRVRGWGLVQREEYHGVQIVRAAGTTFRPRRFISRAANYVSYFLSACLAGMRIPRPDVVVSLTDPPIIGLAALLTARRCKARFVFVCQDVFPEVAWLLEDFHNATVNRLLDRINRMLIREADRVVALGEVMRERLIAGKGAEPWKVKVIHNWADCTAIVPGSKRNPFSIAHGLAEAFVVMHSGNLGLSQSLETLIDAASRLRPYHDLVLAMVGDGTKREALELKARSQGLANVRFFPYQPKESLRESFASADVFVISLKRGLAGYIVPSKLYGILAAGRPYVAAVEGACEVAAITKQYHCGLLAEPADPKDLADKILTLYHDPNLAQRLGANARRAALAFDRPLQVQAYYDLFREVTEGLSTPRPRYSVSAQTPPADSPHYPHLVPPDRRE
jgi:colanic acid biosynthesis glycosyl transferase WcaI